jgi:hypothetical protein
MFERPDLVADPPDVAGQLGVVVEVEPPGGLASLEGSFGALSGRDLAVES